MALVRVANVVCGLGEDDMTKEYSIIQGGKVINRIICSEEFALKYAEENGVEVTDEDAAIIGASVSEGRFIKPQAPEIKKSEVEILKDALIAKGIISRQ